MAKELSIKSPRARLSDRIPTSIKIFWKKRVSPIFGGNPYYHTIIPRTEQHGEWILGAQPDLKTLQGFLEDEDTTSVHVVSMLGDDETIISDDDIGEGRGIKRSRKHWFDHSILDQTTGKNQTTQAMVAFQGGFYDEFFSKSKSIFYCHCMAGRSRSLLETLSFIYFCPEDKRRQMFDTSTWPRARESIKARLKAQGRSDLFERLREDPSFKDISDFVSAVRPKAKRYEKLDGDQAGLLGLMALDKMEGGCSSYKKYQNISDDDIELILEKSLAYNKGEREHFLEEYKGLSSSKKLEIIARMKRYVVAEVFPKGKLWMDMSQDKLLAHALDIGLMLKAPLDPSFRDVADRKEQEDKLASVFEAYQYHGINLLEAMILPRGDRPKTTPDFERNFSRLPVNEQTRFAILAYGLEKRGLETGLSKKAIEYAKIALENIDQISAGDQIELLKTFGTKLVENPTQGSEDMIHSDDPRYSLGLYTQSIIDKILQGDQLDRFNQVGKLVELWRYVPKGQEGRVEVAVKKMTYRAQIDFVKQLKNVDWENAKRLFGEINQNYQKKWYRFFYDPLRSTFEDARKVVSRVGSDTRAPVSDSPGILGALEDASKELALNVSDYIYLHYGRLGFALSPKNMKQCVRDWGPGNPGGMIKFRKEDGGVVSFEDACASRGVDLKDDDLVKLWKEQLINKAFETEEQRAAMLEFFKQRVHQGGFLNMLQTTCSEMLSTQGMSIGSSLEDTERSTTFSVEDGSIIIEEKIIINKYVKLIDGGEIEEHPVNSEAAVRTKLFFDGESPKYEIIGIEVSDDPFNRDILFTDVDEEKIKFVKKADVELEGPKSAPLELPEEPKESDKLQVALSP